MNIVLKNPLGEIYNIELIESKRIPLVGEIIVCNERIQIYEGASIVNFYVFPLMGLHIPAWVAEWYVKRLMPTAEINVFKPGGKCSLFRVVKKSEDGFDYAFEWGDSAGVAWNLAAFYCSSFIYMEEKLPWVQSGSTYAGVSEYIVNDRGSSLGQINYSEILRRYWEDVLGTKQ